MITTFEQLLNQLLAQACANLRGNVRVSKDVFSKISGVKDLYIIRSSEDFFIPENICIVIGTVEVDGESFVIFA